MTDKSIHSADILDRPEPKAIGFVDEEQQLHAVIDALVGAGYVADHIIVMHGESGLTTLRRLQKTFHFGDGEDALLDIALRELQLGHYAVGVEVYDRDTAVQLSHLLEPVGAHSFSYFGTWQIERLTL